MIDVILPVLNESEALPGVIASFPDGFRPLVVDNGSTDCSAEIARSLGVEVVEEPQRGFGAACFTGLITASSEIVCFMDCDGSLDPRSLPVVCEQLVGADLVLGRRKAPGGSFPLHSRVGNKVLARAVRRRTGIRVTDIGPMRAAPRKGLLELGLMDRRFGWPLEMVMKAAAAGWRIAEVPVPYGKRIGRSKVTGTVRGTVRTVRDMRKILA